MTRFDRRTLLIGAGASLALAACGRSEADPAPPPPAPGKAGKLIAAARAQIGVTLRYDAAYMALPFPGGDVPRERGVCTDVVIRAYRDALGLDLQALVNADMRSAFAAYPRTWGLRAPDRSIDHRRVPNLRTGWLARERRFRSPRMPPAGGRATSSPRLSTAPAPISAWSRTGAGRMAG